MGMDTGQFVPDSTEPFRPGRHFYFHHFFHGAAVPPAMAERTNPADPFCHIDILLEVTKFHKLFQPAVHITDRRNRTDNLFILQFQIQMDRFGKNGMLRTERNHCAFTHFLSLLPVSPLPRRKRLSRVRCGAVL